MPINYTCKTIRDKMFCDIASRMENCSKRWSERRYIRVRMAVPVPMKIVAGGGAVVEPAWKGVAAALGRDNSCTRT